MRVGYRHIDAAMAYGNQEEVRWAILLEAVHVTNEHLCADSGRFGLEESYPICRET